MSQIIGHISQVIGPVVDVYFEGTESDLILPSIHDALEIKRHNGKKLIEKFNNTLVKIPYVRLPWIVPTACSAG